VAELFSDFFAWMEGLSPLWAYAVVLVIAYGENVVPPIPGDMVVVFGGYLAGRGTLSLPVVVVLATVGGALGFMTVYAVGRRLGVRVRDPARRPGWLPQDGLDRAERWLDRYGYGVVAANRFLSGARSVISLAVGVAQMDVGRTALWCTVSAAVWTGLITYAGYAVGENWQLVRGYLEAYGRTVASVLVVLALAYLARWAWRRRNGDGAGARTRGGEGERETGERQP
jgi:membrane protein DedA with SNARE-associated domain